MMSPKQRGQLALLFVALTALGAVIVSGKELAPADSQPGTSLAAAADAKVAATHVVRVVYFRTTARCASCKKIEAFTEAAIKERFAKEIENGKMIWQVVDVQAPGNEHYIQEYQLAAKAVVVMDLVNGVQVRWKNLARIWELLHDQTRFESYVADEVRQYLEGRS